MVAIANNSGVVLCEQYEGAIKICQHCSQWFPRSICFEQRLSSLAILDGRMSTTKSKKKTKKNEEHIESVFNLTAEMLNREAVEKMKPMKHSLNFQLVSRKD